MVRVSIAKLHAIPLRQDFEFMTRSSLLHITPETHSVQIDLVYATDRNFTGKPIYKAAHCLLLQPAETALRKAVEIARSIGTTLRIFDAYRPPQAQKVLWDFLPDPTFIAELGRGSNHSRGTALDLTLVDADGNELDMGTGFDAMVAESGHFHAGLPEHVQRNRTLLLGVMHGAGFTHIQSEWWHYELPGWRELALIDNHESGPLRLM
jgi:D-alanyl-D-alanine dipeptidase